MKCVFISLSIGDNKVHNYYKELGNSFLKHNYKVVYIYDNQVVNLPESGDGIYYYTWPSSRPTKFKDFKFLQKLIKIHQPDICISIFGAVNVMTLVSYFNGVKNRIAWIRTTNKQITLDSKNILKSKILNLRKRFVYKLLTQVYANSNGTRLNAIKTFKIKEDKIKVLHNLTNKSDIGLKPFKDREFSITIVGRLNLSKGHKELLTQFKELVIIYPLLTLNIIGDGYLKEELIRYVDELDIVKNVIFHGNVSNNLISTFFSKTLIGVSASYSEAFGWVNIEALREGTPIISTKTEGAEDIIIENNNGLFFTHSNVNSLKENIEEIISKWDQYSKGAIEVFTTKFSIENQIENHCDIILKDLNN